MKRQRQMGWLLSGGLAAAVAFAPASAAAQSTQYQEQETMRIGPFQLRPRLAFTNIGVDYNVFNDNENPQRDFTFTAAPDVEVSVHPGRLRLAFRAVPSSCIFRSSRVNAASTTRSGAAPTST